MRTACLAFFLAWVTATGAGEAAWIRALQAMPLPGGPQVLNHSNCAPAVLGNFTANAIVKAVVFLPGATDELYFFRRVQAWVTNAAPTLWDAMVALTNQTPLRVTCRSNFVLLHSAEDVLELDYQINHPGTLAKLQSARPIPKVLALDWDWTRLVGAVKSQVPATLLPYERTRDSWHFYRHTFAGWDLTPWELLQAAAWAGKTKFTVVRRGVVFAVDERVGELPKLDRFPGR